MTPSLILNPLSVFSDSSSPRLVLWVAFCFQFANNRSERRALGLDSAVALHYLLLLELVELLPGMALNETHN